MTAPEPVPPPVMFFYQAPELCLFGTGRIASYRETATYGVRREPPKQHRKATDHG